MQESNKLFGFVSQLKIEVEQFDNISTFFSNHSLQNFNSLEIKIYWKIWISKKSCSYAKKATFDEKA